MPRYTGNPEAQRQPPERQWERNKGWVTVDVWIGSEQAINGLIPALTASYDNLDISTSDGVVYKVRASIGNANDGSEEQPVEVWELLGAGLQEALTRHPNYAALPQADRDKLDKVASGSSEADSYTSASFATGEAVSFWRMLQRQQTSYQDSQWVLRHTVTVSSRAEVQVSMTGINKLWYTEDLPDTSATPGIEAALAAIPIPAGVPQEHVYAWLKQTPTITQALNSRTQVTEEWFLYFWPTLLYDEL
jgi:hypothetical protein